MESSDLTLILCLIIVTIVGTGIVQLLTEDRK